MEVAGSAEPAWWMSQGQDEVYPALFEALPDAAVVFDDDGNLHDANDRACDLLQRAKAELSTLRIADIVETPMPVIEEMMRRFRAEGALDGDVVFRTPDGGRIAAEFRARANIDRARHLATIRARGAMPSFVPQLTAIQAQTLAANVQVADVMQAICTQAMVIANADGAAIERQEGDDLIYRVVAGAMTTFVGLRIPKHGSFSGLALERREVLMCPDTELDPRVNRAACRKVGARSMVVVPLVHGDDVVGVLKVASTRPHGFDKSTVDLMRLVAGFLASAMATTSAAEARRALEQRELTRLVELERLREEMTALLVHDLRSPLQVILSNVEFMRDELSSASRDALEAAADAITATKRLDTLIKMLLETAKLEQGRLVLQRTPLQLASVAHEVCQARVQEAKTRTVRIESDVDPELRVSADAELVRRSVENIVDNALRFVPPGGSIHVSAERRGDRTHLRIANSGPPIPVTIRGRIFEKFAQAGSAHSRANFGLGLYFCKLVAEAHNGTIRIDDDGPFPTVFVIELPAADAT